MLRIVLLLFLLLSLLRFYKKVGGALAATESREIAAKAPPTFLPEWLIAKILPN